jgi:hypothetical protein
VIFVISLGAAPADWRFGSPSHCDIEGSGLSWEDPSRQIDGFGIASSSSSFFFLWQAGWVLTYVDLNACWHVPWSSLA